MAGLALIWMGERLFPGVHFDWLDPVAAIAVALLIIRTAYELTIRSAQDLLDVSLPEEEKWIRNELARLDLPIRGFHSLRTRKAGATRFVELHIVLDNNMSIQESHRISDQIVAKIKEKFPDTQVTVHEEPCDGSCAAGCLDGCLIGERERRMIRNHEQELEND